MEKMTSKYLTNYRFRVVLGQQKEEICFARISGIQQGIEYEEIQEGGNNGSAVTLVVPSKKNDTLVLERGFSNNAGEDSWLRRVRPGLRLGTGLEIFVLNLEGNIIRKFIIDDGLITKWEAGPLDAMGQDVLIEKLEIVYEGLRVE